VSSSQSQIRPNASRVVVDRFRLALEEDVLESVNSLVIPGERPPPGARRADAD
jgi:hypothetical protein